MKSYANFFKWMSCLIGQTLKLKNNIVNSEESNYKSARCMTCIKNAKANNTDFAHVRGHVAVLPLNYKINFLPDVKHVRNFIL